MPLWRCKGLEDVLRRSRERRASRDQSAKVQNRSLGHVLVCHRSTKFFWSNDSSTRPKSDSFEKKSCVRFSSDEEKKYCIFANRMEVLNKDGRYRMRHPDRIIESRHRHYEKHKEKYAEKRRERYLQNRTKILEKIKLDRAECPFCSNITFNRQYLPKHIATRHKMDPSTVLTKESCPQSSSPNP